MLTVFPVELFPPSVAALHRYKFRLLDLACDDLSPLLKISLRLFPLALWKRRKGERRWRRYTDTSVSAVLASDLFLYSTGLFRVDIIYYVYAYWRTSRCSWPKTVVIVIVVMGGWVGGWKAATRKKRLKSIGNSCAQRRRHTTISRTQYSRQTPTPPVVYIYVAISLTWWNI